MQCKLGLIHWAKFNPSFMRALFDCFAKLEMAGATLDRQVSFETLNFPLEFFVNVFKTSLSCRSSLSFVTTRM